MMNASRNAALAHDAEDDFWGQAPVAATQPAATAHHPERRLPEPANDAQPAHWRPADTSAAIFLGRAAQAAGRARFGRIAAGRLAAGAAAIAVVATLGAAAVLAWPSGEADRPATPVAETGAPIETVAAAAATPKAAEPAVIRPAAEEDKAQALMEAAADEPAPLPAASQSAPTASSGPTAEAAPTIEPAAQTGNAPSFRAAQDVEAADAFPTDAMATAALTPLDAAPLAAAGEDASPAGTGIAAVEETDAPTAPSEIELLSAAATSTTVKKWVNMRSGPDDEAASITVIPADAEISLISCDGWCHVIYEGQQGWVYKSFVRGAEEEVAAQDG